MYHPRSTLSRSSRRSLGGRRSAPPRRRSTPSTDLLRDILGATNDQSQRNTRTEGTYDTCSPPRPTLPGRSRCSPPRRCIFFGRSPDRRNRWMRSFPASFRASTCRHTPPPHTSTWRFCLCLRPHWEFHKIADTITTRQSGLLGTLHTSQRTLILDLYFFRLVLTERRSLQMKLQVLSVALENSRLSISSPSETLKNRDSIHMTSFFQYALFSLP